MAVDTLVDLPPPVRQDAWRGRKSHRRDAGVWLWKVHQDIPVWKHQWRRAINHMRCQGRARYRGVWIEKNEVLERTLARQGNAEQNQIRPAPFGGSTGVVLSPSNPDLFLTVHSDLVGLVSSLPGAAREGGMSLVLEILLGQWPNEQAWTKAVRHRAAMIKTGMTPKEVGRGWERILRERKSSLVLAKRPSGEWRTRKDGSLKQVLESSTLSRQKAIKALIRLPGMVSLEMPRQLRFTVVLKVARSLRKVLRSDHPLVTQALSSGRTWGLAVRTIHSLGVKGCFDPATQTVIVDPRHLDTAIHELCHWLLGHEPQWASQESFQRAESEVDALLKDLKSHLALPSNTKEKSSAFQ